MQPKIAIGCPVRNRAWVLPEYLGALTMACISTKFNPMFIFLENDSEDDTLFTLRSFKNFTETVPPHDECIIESISTASPHWNHGDYAHDQYANLARVRNHFLDMFLKTDADFLLSVDSDVIVPPDIVTRLLAHMDGHTIVGAAISNVPDKPLDGQTPGNFMTAWNTYVGVDVKWVRHYFHPTVYTTIGTFEVDLIGAVYLIPRTVIEAGARYAPHPTGEDAPFCEAARRLGYRLLVDMDVRCEHRMVKV